MGRLSLHGWAICAQSCKQWRWPQEEDLETAAPGAGCMRPGQLSGAIKVPSRIPFKDTGSKNVLVSFKARSPG